MYCRPIDLFPLVYLPIFYLDYFLRTNNNMISISMLIHKLHSHTHIHLALYISARFNFYGQELIYDFKAAAVIAYYKSSFYYTHLSSLARPTGRCIITRVLLCECLPLKCVRIYVTRGRKRPHCEMLLTRVVVSLTADVNKTCL